MINQLFWYMLRESESFTKTHFMSINLASLVFDILHNFPTFLSFKSDLTWFVIILKSYLWCLASVHSRPMCHTKHVLLSCSMHLRFSCAPKFYNILNLSIAEIKQRNLSHFLYKFNPQLQTFFIKSENIFSGYSLFLWSFIHTSSNFVRNILWKVGQNMPSSWFYFNVQPASLLLFIKNKTKQKAKHGSWTNPAESTLS